jgi:hypothetical protein
MWSRKFLKTGSVILVLCALAHLAGHILSMDAPPRNEAEKRLVDAMTGYVIPDLGVTMQSLQDGFSLSFSVFCAGFGLLVFTAAGSAEAALRRRFALLAALSLIALSALGWRYWFLAPNSFLTAAALSYSAAWVAARREPLLR